jgi:hypothetical protein
MAEPQPPATPDDGPTTTVTLAPGGRPIQVVMPADPDRLLDDPEVLARNARDGFMPYWAYLWPGAFVLAEAVARRSWAPGTRALEIGCGLGLAGLAGVAAGLDVTFTEYDPAPLRFVARSLAANGFGPDGARVQTLDWNQPPEDWYPLILGADVLYERANIEPIARLLDRMLGPGGQALFGGTYRIAAEAFPDALGPFGMRCTTEPLAIHDHQGRAIDGTLWHVRRLDLAG